MDPTARELLDALQLFTALNALDIPVPPKHAEAVAKARAALDKLTQKYASAK